MVTTYARKPSEVTDALAALKSVLDDALDEAPNELELLRARASLRGRHSMWKDAAEDLPRILDQDPTGHWSWYRLAPLVRKTADPQRYRSHCVEMRERCSSVRHHSSFQCSCELAPLKLSWQTAETICGNDGIVPGRNARFSNWNSEQRNSQFVDIEGTNP